MVDADTKSAKHAASQQRRLQSLREKQEIQKQKQKLVSEALKAVDSGNAKNNKRIVFDSDGSDKEEEEVVSKKPKVISKRLFEDSDDEEPDLEKQDPDSLITTGRLTGKSSGKLMHLENKYGYDNRFQLDNTFLEDDEKEEDTEIQYAQEKERQLRLLSMVVGRDVKPRQEAVVKKSNVRTFQRFDPQNPEHVKWMENFSKQNESESEDKKTEEDIDEEKPTTAEPSKPVVDERRFYEINQDFAAELRAKILSGQKETISFLTKKKKHDSDDDAEEEEEKVEPKNKITSDAEQKKKVEVNMQRVSLVPCFFRERGDANITSKLEKFYSSRSIQINKWKTARDAFKKQARQIRKHRIRELDIKKK